MKLAKQNSYWIAFNRLFKTDFFLQKLNETDSIRSYSRPKLEWFFHSYLVIPINSLVVAHQCLSMHPF